jgi:hypothetical protein
MELEEVTSREISSAEQVKQLQSELRLLQDEINSLKAAQVPAKNKEGSPK